MNGATPPYDEELNPVLEKASREELSVLHDILMGKLSETLSIEDAYKAHYPDHEKYPDLIAKEIRDFGGNSIANVFRGEGPPYREIVWDVAKAIKAPFRRESPVEEIEASILATILSKAFERMSDDEKEVLLEQIGRPDRSAVAPGSVQVFLAIFKAGGFGSYRLMLIVVNAVVKGVIGRGLPLAANAALARAMGVVTGPVGWAVTTMLTVIRIAGPSYKVTIPSVAYVAMLRKMQDTLHCGCGAVISIGFRFCPECGEEIRERSPQPLAG
ncbi:MAG: hypothetical protein OXU77_11165 [Gammaproteobacteria bacterium]|nr:hypothetical protein [Gammaproteobacteria bacterium]